MAYIVSEMQSNYLCEPFSVISSCLTEEDLVVAASVTRAASSRRPAAFSMEAAARSRRTIDAAAFAAVPFLGEEEDMAIVVVWLNLACDFC